MKTLILMCAVLGTLFVAFDASAIIVGARGVILCTAIDTDDNCTGGTFWDAKHELSQTSSPCDWTGATSCKVWKPMNPTPISSFTGAYGVNWSCCVSLETNEDPTTYSYGFHFYDIAGQDWSNNLGIEPDWEGYIGTNVQNYSYCNEGNYVYQGKDDFSDDGSVPWNYGYSTSKRIARCGGQVFNTVTKLWSQKVIEYWLY